MYTEIGPLKLFDDLRIVGSAGVPLSPKQGLNLAEELTRLSFRKILEDEAARMALPPFE